MKDSAQGDGFDLDSHPRTALNGKNNDSQGQPQKERLIDRIYLLSFGGVVDFLAIMPDIVEIIIFATLSTEELENTACECIV